MQLPHPQSTSRPSRVKTRLQTTTKCRNSTNNDKITCIRCEIMNLPLKILTCDSMHAGEYRRTRQSWRIPTDSAVATQIIAKIPMRSTYSQHHFKNSHQIIVLLIEFFQINNSSYRNNGAVDRIFPN